MFLSYGCPYDLKRSSYEDFSLMCDFFQVGPTSVDRRGGKRQKNAARSKINPFLDRIWIPLQTGNKSEKGSRKRGQKTDLILELLKLFLFAWFH